MLVSVLTSQIKLPITYSCLPALRGSEGKLPHACVWLSKYLSVALSLLNCSCSFPISGFFQVNGREAVGMVCAELKSVTIKNAKCSQP